MIYLTSSFVDENLKSSREILASVRTSKSQYCPVYSNVTECLALLRAHGGRIWPVCTTLSRVDRKSKPVIFIGHFPKRNLIS